MALSPLNQRRWRNFKANRRALWSLGIFAVLFGLSLFAHWPVPVVYVPGNHEYDAMDFDAAHQRLRASCDKFGFHWLEREVLVLQGVRFVGTTLWSDFDALLERLVNHARAALAPGEDTDD